MATSRVSAGNYVVQFPADVSACIYAPNVMSALPNWESTVVPAPGTGTAISVGVSNNSGSFADTTVTVLVYCPDS